MHAEHIYIYAVDALSWWVHMPVEDLAWRTVAVVGWEKLETLQLILGNCNLPRWLISSQVILISSGLIEPAPAYFFFRFQSPSNVNPISLYIICHLSFLHRTLFSRNQGILNHFLSTVWGLMSLVFSGDELHEPLSSTVVHAIYSIWAKIIRGLYPRGFHFKNGATATPEVLRKTKSIRTSALEPWTVNHVFGVSIANNRTRVPSNIWRDMDCPRKIARRANEYRCATIFALL